MSLRFHDLPVGPAIGDIEAADVTAQTVAARGWPAEPMLIEFVVGKEIDVVRANRMRINGLPVLEIDLSELRGRQEDRDLVRYFVRELAGKRWVHHPAITKELQTVEQRRNALVRKTPPGRV
jgi:hypothetical protein